MLKRIKIVTSLLLVLAVFGLLQLTSGAETGGKKLGGLRSVAA